MQFNSNGWRFDMKYISFNDIQQYSTNGTELCDSMTSTQLTLQEDQGINFNFPGGGGGGGNPANPLSTPPFKYFGNQILTRDRQDYYNQRLNIFQHINLILLYMLASHDILKRKL